MKVKANMQSLRWVLPQGFMGEGHSPSLESKLLPVQSLSHQYKLLQNAQASINIRNVGMACQKVCKQGRNMIHVYQCESQYTKPHPCLIVHPPALESSSSSCPTLHAPHPSSSSLG